MILDNFKILILVLLLLPAGLDAQFVEARNGVFYLGSERYRFTGTNSYFLLQEIARGNRDIVDYVFSAARDANMSVVRTWAFYDDPGSRYALQTRPGEYSERVFRALDYLIYKAAEYDLRLILVLTNNWEDYGGSMQYVRWSPTATTRDDFYTDYYTRQYYKQYVHDILTRTNTYTGIKYKNDNTIFSWELINEPTSFDESGRIVRRWIDEMAEYVKSIDGNHLLGTGGGGWDNSFILYEEFLESIPVNQKQLHWILNGSRGVSYSLNIRSEFIDYASAHVYPDAWNLSTYQTMQWLRNLRMIAADEGKPFVIGEFGKRTKRELAVNTIFGSLFSAGADGALVWNFPEVSEYNTEGFAFNGESDPDAVRALQDAGRRITTGQPFNFDDSIFDTELPLPFYLIREGSLGENIESIWYNVSVNDRDDKPEYSFGRRGSVEFFICGIFRPPVNGYLQIRARGDLRKIWIESHIRGQWLQSYTGYASDYTDVFIPLSDLGLDEGHIEYLKLFSDEGGRVNISGLSIQTKR